MIDNNIPYTTRPSCCSCSCRFPFSSNGGNPGIDPSSASSSRLEYVCCILFRSRSSPCRSCKSPLKYRLIMPPPKGRRLYFTPNLALNFHGFVPKTSTHSITVIDRSNNRNAWHKSTQCCSGGGLAKWKETGEWVSFCFLIISGIVRKV